MNGILYSLNIKCTKALKKHILWAFSGHGQRLVLTKNQSLYTLKKKE